MKSYEVVETLRKSRKAVFTPKDIAKITGLNGSKVYVLISGKADYWESELKPLVIGTLPRFEVVYKAVDEGIM